MAAPVLVEYLTGLGFALSMAGVLSGLFAFASMGTRPLSGILTDRINRKHLLIGAQVLMAIAMLLGPGLGSTFLVNFAAKRGIEGVSLHFTVNAVTLLILRVVLAKYIGKVGIRQLLIPSFLTGIFSLLCIVWSHVLSLLLISAVLKAISYGLWSARYPD